MSFENWWMGELLPRRSLGALPQYYYGSMTPEELLYKIVYQLNELITNNNSIPTETQAAITEYVNSDAFKTLIYQLTDPKYVSKVGDDMTGSLNFKGTSHIVFKDISGGTNRALLALSAQPSERAFMMLNANGKIQLNSLATPTTDEAAANKKYVDDKIASLGNVLDFKGVKATQAELPTTGNNVGDVWYVEATKSAWAWVKDTTDPNGRWDEFGPVIDLSPYFKKSDIAQTTGTSTTKVISQKGVSDNFLKTKEENLITGEPIWIKHTSTGSDPFRGSAIRIYDENDSNTLIVCQHSAPDNIVNHAVFGMGANGLYWEGETIRGAGAIKPLADNASLNVYDHFSNAPHRIKFGVPEHPYKWRISGVAEPTDDDDAATKSYVDTHSSGGYTLPTASENTLGGVKAPAKTLSDNRQVTVDSEGNLWTEDITPYELPVANYNRLGGIKASVDACPVPAQRQGICVEPSGLAWVPKLMPANSTKLGGVQADESSEPMPVEIAIDPTTHKLKGSLMTAYQSPTTIGGVVMNIDKSTVSGYDRPVAMDSDGKLWVNSSYKSPDKISFLGDNLRFDMQTSNSMQSLNIGKILPAPSLVVASFTSKGVSTDIAPTENNNLTNKVYVDNHLSGKTLDAPTAAGQIAKYNGTKVIWETPAAPAPGTAQTGHIAVAANATTVTITDSTYRYCIASIMGMPGNWIKDIAKTSTGFDIEVNAAPTAANTCIICYMLFN